MRGLATSYTAKVNQRTTILHHDPWTFQTKVGSEKQASTCTHDCMES